jgi:membrane protein YdbS with pleckstrin-like domain
MQLKPDRLAFIWYGIGKSIIWYVITNVGLILGAFIFFNSGYLIYALISLLLSTIGVLYGVLTRFIQYQKESYEILPDKIIYKSGSLFFDRQVDLPLAKVTLVEQVLPFIETSLFKTGNIRIETAGSGSTEVQLTSILDTQKVRQYLEDRLIELGMDLGKNELVQTEKPTAVGAVLGAITWLLGSLAVFIWLSAFLTEILPVALIVFVGLLVFISGVALGVLRYLDYKRRQYLVYRSSLVYDEGFLTKKYAFIPLANLSDSETSQGLIHKIFGFYDIVLSTRGSGNDITFQAMPGGKKLEENIDLLIKRQAEEVSVKTTTKSVGKQPTKQIKQDALLGNDYTKTIRLSIVKLVFEKLVGFAVFLPLFGMVVFGEVFVYIAGLLALILIPSAIFTVIGTLIQYISFTYFVKESSVKYSYNFLSRSEKEFNLAKVTSLQVRRSWLDYILGTCSINFTSIGSSSKLSFKNIKHDQELIDQLRSKLKMLDGKVLREIKPQFSIWQWFLAQFWVWVMLVIGIFFIVAILLLAGEISAILPLMLALGAITGLIIVSSIVYDYVFAIRAKLQVYEGYLYRVVGIFVREHKFVPVNYVKDISSKKYPLVTGGQFRVNIAGDILPENNKSNQFQAQQSQAGQNSAGAASIASLYSNNLEMKYISDVFDQDDYLNRLISGKELEAKPSYNTKPMPINETVVGVIFSIFMPFLLPAVVWRYLAITRMNYGIYSDRVVYTYGIVHSHRLTICYDQIDHLEQSVGAVNQIFKNGNVAIYTEGSSFVEMSINNIKDYQEFKSRLQQHLEA